MRTITRTWAILANFSLALLVNQTPAASEPLQKPLKAVAVLLGDLGNPFFETVARSIENDVHHLAGDDVTVSIASSGYDVGRQIKQINDYVSQGYDLLILNAADTDLIAETVRAATAKGTVVVAIDVNVPGAQATVTSDNVEAGTLACRFMAEKLQYKGAVVILNGPPVSAVIDRVAGCKLALAQYSGITILSDDQNAGASYAGGLASMSSLMANYSKIDAVFSINDPCSIGAEFAARQAGRKDFFIVSVDASPQGLEVMRSPDSLMVATVAQDPRAMAARAVEAGYKLFLGDLLADTSYRIPVTLVRKEDLQNFEGWSSSGPKTDSTGQ